MPPRPIIQEAEPKLMMEPPPATFMSSSTACEAKNWCFRFTPMRSSQYSGVTSSVTWRSSRAALLTRMVMGPSADLILSMARRSASMSRTSQSSKCDLAPAPAMLAITSAAAVSSMSMKPTWVFCLAKASTMEAPMPLAPPVTSATLPASEG